jgi:heat-inducible transcriptional repressor
MQLTPRQAALLKAVVLEFQATGRPVGSKTLLGVVPLQASASTVRAELAMLERRGYLTHPHTSAGRVPTDLGYRTYVDELVGDEDLALRTAAGQLLLESAAARLDDALAHTTQALADATQLLAVITSPAGSGATIRHVEVLQVQPTTIVVVAITSTGDVARHVVSTPRAVDSGLVDWAGAYLSDTVTGMSLGQNLLRSRLADPELSPAERWILDLLAPAFTDLAAAEGSQVHVGGSPALLERLGQDVQQVVNLVHALDERRRLLGSLRALVGVGAPGAVAAGRRQRVTVRIGAENELPELRPLSIVGAGYGLRARPLGMVGLIGPRALDYPAAMRYVDAAAQTLSAYVADLYHEA